MYQKDLEYLIHPRHILNDVITELQSCTVELEQATELVHNWLNQDAEYESKQERKDVLKTLDMHTLILGLLARVIIHTYEKPLPLANLANMCTIKQLTKLQSIKAVCELLAVLSKSDFFTLKKINSTYYLESNLIPNENIQSRLNLYCYLPPMICKPKKLKHNNSSAYLTINQDSLILGFSDNYHTGNISLDVLNTLNQNMYELDIDFISKHTKPFNPNKDLEEQDFKQEQITYEQYQEQFQVLTNHLQQQTIYFTHKVDKRGRIYTQGYHFNTQGSSYEKASINLKHKELIQDNQL